jgi:hypothetical protein
LTALALLDERWGSRDPTGTSRLRARFRADAKLRLRQLRAQMRTALMEQDVLGLNQGTIMGFHPADVRLTAFHAWLAYMAGHYLAGSWPDRFIDLAWESGRQAAVLEVYSGGRVPPQTLGNPQHLAQLAKQELEGIIAATVQQVSRAAANVLTRRLKPAPAWRVLAAAFDKVTLNRLMAMCNVLIIAAFNQAKIETYRGVGIDRVGIIPETVDRKLMHDADDPDDQPSEGEHFAKIAEVLLALGIAGALAQKQQETIQPRVGVQTAGDDRVCDKCDKIAADSPYTLDYAATLIPVHPNCRCSVYAWRG